MKNANFPADDHGRVYHLGLKAGELASTIITVGDPARATRIAEAYLVDSKVFSSHRGFLTITGTYKNRLHVSLVAIGMGLANMDIFVREARAVTDGPMRIVRFGSCGALDESLSVGSLAVASEGAFLITQDPDGETYNQKYRFSKICPCDSKLSRGLVDNAAKLLSSTAVKCGLNATADSFYSSQGRRDPNFDDKNEHLISQISTKYPNALTLEMETFQLFHLARSCQNTRIRTSAIKMIFANRKTNDFIDHGVVPELEKRVGQVILEALLNDE